MSGPDRDQIKQAQSSEGRGWRFYLMIAIAALAAIFVIQNTDETNISFLFATTEMPLFFALIIAILLGVAIGWLTPRFRRSSRER